MRSDTIRDRNEVVVRATSLFTHCHTHAYLPSLLDLLFSTYLNTSFSCFYSVLHCSIQFFILEIYPKKRLEGQFGDPRDWLSGASCFLR